MLHPAIFVGFAAQTVPIVVIITALAVAAFFFCQIPSRRRYLAELEELRGLRHAMETATPDSPVDTGLDADTSLIGRFIQKLRERPAAHASPQAALELLEREDDTAFSHTFPNTLIALLLVLGLAGTLLSFHNAVGNPEFGKVGGSVSIVKMDAYVGTVAEGLQGAFWPSFTGIMATIFLFCMRAFLVQPARDRFFTELLDFGQTTLARSLGLGKDGTLEEALVGTADTLKSLVGDLRTVSADLRKAASASVASTEMLKVTAKPLERSAERFEQAFGETSPVNARIGALSDVVKGFTESVQREAEDHGKALTELRRSFTDSRQLIAQVESAAGSIAAALPAITGASEAFTEAAAPLAQTVTVLEQTLAETKGLHGQFKILIGQVSQLAQLVTADQVQRETSIRTLTSMVEECKACASRSESALQTVLASSEMAKHHQAETRQHWHQFFDTLNRHQSAIENATAAASRNWLAQLWRVLTIHRK